VRVLFLTCSVDGQSNYLRARSLAESLAGKGHDVTLLSAPARPELRGRCEEVRIGQGALRSLCVGSRASTRLRNSGLSVPEAWRRRASLAGESFDLIHGFGHRPTVGWVGPALARDRGVPYVADWSDLFGNGGIAHERTLLERWTLGAFDRWQEPRVYRRADAVTVISLALQERASRLNGNLPVVRVPPGGLPAAEAGSGEATRRRLGIPARAPLVIHVSQNHQDLELLRRALIGVAKLRADVHFLLVGPRFPSLQGAALPHCLRARLHFTGAVLHGQIAGLLAAADVAMLPYPPSIKNQCRFPCSFAEYAGAGLPIVTQPTGDLREVADGSAALLVPDDGEAMARGVDRILRDPRLASTLSRGARRLARVELSWSVGAQRLLELYGQLTPTRVSPVLAIP